MSLFLPWRCWFEYQFLCYFGNGDSWTQDPSGALFSFPADLSLLESWWGSGSWIASPRKAPLCSFIFNKGGKRERCCRWHGTKTHYPITHIVSVYIPDYNIQTNSPRIRELKRKQWWHQRCASHGNRPGSLGFVAVGPEDCQHAEVLVLGDVAAGIDYVAGLQRLQVWLLVSL